MPGARDRFKHYLTYLKQHADELLQKLEAAGIPTRGPVMSAAYNAPFTPVRPAPDATH